MFTIKFRTYALAPIQCEGAPLCYDENEQLHGPFDFVSKERDEDGCSIVHCHRGTGPAISFKDTGLDEVAGAKRPRPTLWVMNEHGATVATYLL